MRGNFLFCSLLSPQHPELCPVPRKSSIHPLDEFVMPICILSSLSGYCLLILHDPTSICLSLPWFGAPSPFSGMGISIIARTTSHFMPPSLWVLEGRGLQDVCVLCPKEVALSLTLGGHSVLDCWVSQELGSKGRAQGEGGSEVAH